MEFLRLPELQGVAAIIAILEFLILLKERTKPTSTLSQPAVPLSNLTSTNKTSVKVVGLIVFLFFGWVIYSSPWALFAFGLGFRWWLVLSPTFFILGSLPPLGVVAIKPAFLGGFLGGGIPLGSLALFFTSINPQMSSIATPFAYFVVFSIFGGILGALSGPATVKVVQRLGLPLPLQ